MLLSVIKMTIFMLFKIHLIYSMREPCTTHWTDLHIVIRWWQWCGKFWATIIVQMEAYCSVHTFQVHVMSVSILCSLSQQLHAPDDNTTRSSSSNNLAFNCMCNNLFIFLPVYIHVVIGPLQSHGGIFSPKSIPIIKGQGTPDPSYSDDICGYWQTVDSHVWTNSSLLTAFKDACLWQSTVNHSFTRVVCWSIM